MMCCENIHPTRRKLPAADPRVKPKPPFGSAESGGSMLTPGCSSAEEGSRLRLMAPEVGERFELEPGEQVGRCFPDRNMVKLLGDIGNSWIVRLSEPGTGPESNSFLVFNFDSVQLTPFLFSIF